MTFCVPILDSLRTLLFKHFVSLSHRLKWQTRGRSSQQQDLQMMQLKPAGDTSASALVQPYRPAVALPIFGCLLMIAVYLLCGAGFVAQTTQVDYRDGFYFCFVALCTVGLGGSTVMRHASDGAVVLVVIYVFLGITLLSTILHIVHYDVYVNLRLYRDFKVKKTRVDQKTSSKRPAAVVTSKNSSGDVPKP